MIECKGSVFSLSGDNYTYQMMVDSFGRLLHLYHGPKIQGDASSLLSYRDRGFSPCPYEAGKDRTVSYDYLPLETSILGDGDFRTPALILEGKGEEFSPTFVYKNHTSYMGLKKLKGLPSAAIEDAEVLEITLEDEKTGTEIVLSYAVKNSSLLRGIEVRAGNKSVVLRKALYSLSYIYGDYDVTYFEGRHCGERTRRRAAVNTGSLTFTSRRGATSHQINNSFIVSEREATENSGNAMSMSLLWSGSFTFFAEQNQYLSTRVALGMGSEYFSYDIGAGESILFPQLLLTFSDKGFGDLSLRNNRFIMDYIRYNAKDGLRDPVLINNWEATYFDFTGEKLISIAKAAKSLGCDLFVLDDGWFGKRSDDFSSLGDWKENTAKLKMDLSELSFQINGQGMAFGLWVEPEMVSEDSLLYKEHPQWALSSPDKKPSRGRYQLVLDLTNREVVEYIISFLDDLVTRGNLRYIKWDYNRFITDFYSSVTPSGRIEYDYILGLYSILQHLNDKFPSLIIEGCSGGGGRFDNGMMYYAPQSWLSDDTDAIERLDIQIGSSYIYPVASFGSHVSAVPNHQTMRTTPLYTRSTVAMMGSYGLELDPMKLTEEEKEEIRAEISEYKRLAPLLKEGDFYRLLDTNEVSAGLFVSPDKTHALLFAVNRLSHGNPTDRYVKLRGLDKNKDYSIDGKIYSGSLLMNAGFLLPFAFSIDYEAVRVELKAL